MTNANSGRFRLSMVSAGVIGLLAMGAAPAAAQSAPPQGWFKVCSKPGDVEVCNVQNIVTASNGQLVTAVSLFEVKGKENKKFFQVTVPSGRQIPAGIALQVNGGKAKALQYIICLPDRCIAELPLDDKVIAEFKKGADLTLTSVNFQNQKNPVKLSLTGFGGAYDGPALREADIQDRQQKLQDFVSKNNDELKKKLQEEQDKAKSAN